MNQQHFGFIQIKLYKPDSITKRCQFIAKSLTFRCFDLHLLTSPIDISIAHFIFIWFHFRVTSHSTKNQEAEPLDKMSKESQ